tara:strand:+ start:216 stop:416 length:201 start_codon:yes stop_codon:yes gene_type:complete
MKNRDKNKIDPAFKPEPTSEEMDDMYEYYHQGESLDAWEDIQDCCDDWQAQYDDDPNPYHGDYSEC